MSHEQVNVRTVLRLFAIVKGFYLRQTVKL